MPTIYLKYIEVRILRRYVLIITLFLGVIVLGALTGLYIYKITNIEDKFQNLEIAEKEVIEDDCTAEYEYMEQIKSANAQKEKISPNARVITNIYYSECGHTAKDTDIVENKYINFTQEEFEKEYEDWEIEKFTKDEIILKKEKQGICNEHYIVKEKDGYLAIYSLDENEKETLQDITEISTQFLPNTDLVKLQEGIRAYGKESLYSLLEDFE